MRMAAWWLVLITMAAALALAGVAAADMVAVLVFLWLLPRL